VFSGTRNEFGRDDWIMANLNYQGNYHPCGVILGFYRFTAERGKPLYVKTQKQPFTRPKLNLRIDYTKPNKPL